MNPLFVGLLKKGSAFLGWSLSFAGIAAGFLNIPKPTLQPNWGQKSGTEFFRAADSNVIPPRNALRPAGNGRSRGYFCRNKR